MHTLRKYFMNLRRCHPERSRARILRPAESKDLRLLLLNFGSTRVVDLR
jgi:hypothetical protein